MEEQVGCARAWRVRAVTLGVIVVALIAASACTSKTRSREQMTEQASAQSRSSGTAQSVSSPGIDLNCVHDRLQNPPESFHYLYKKDASDHVHQEADVSPQVIDGFRTQMDGSQQPLHAMRSDQESWRGALANLTGISGMSSTVALVNHSSAMQREADGGQVNGYSAIHYSIDTARFSPTETHMLLKPGEFEKGDAWVTSTGCPVKLSLDSELHRNDGSLIEKLHYEEAMVKK
jgi:hypothetical protein